MHRDFLWFITGVEDLQNIGTPHRTVLDEVGDRFTNILNLLIRVTEGSERDEVDGLVDGVSVRCQFRTLVIHLCLVAKGRDAMSTRGEHSLTSGPPLLLNR